MTSVARRSYFGIGSCLLFAIATASIMGVIASKSDYPLKWENIEFVVVGPFALLLYVGGLVMAHAGVSDRKNNPGSFGGLVLNYLALVSIALWIGYRIQSRPSQMPPMFRTQSSIHYPHRHIAGIGESKGIA